MTLKQVSVLAVLVAVVLLTATVAPAQLVERTIDGDTIIVRDVGSVRLIGVDTPETVDPRKPVQFFGKEASAFTRQLLKGKHVRLAFDQERRDRYGRVLAYVYLPDGTFVNEQIVKQGYGFAYTRFPFRYLEEFRQLEREARDEGRGLWARSYRPPHPDALPHGGEGNSSPNADPLVRSEGEGMQFQKEDADLVVYVTTTGTKYHRDGCRYLARSQIAMALEDAAATFEPCSVCQPPSMPPRSRPQP